MEISIDWFRPRRRPHISLPPMGGCGVYIAKTVGHPLIQCLTEVCELRPADPIEFIAHWLYKFLDNEEVYFQKMQYLNELQILYYQVELEKTYDRDRADELRSIITTLKAQSEELGEGVTAAKAKERKRRFQQWKESKTRPQPSPKSTSTEKSKRWRKDRGLDRSSASASSSTITDASLSSLDDDDLSRESFRSEDVYSDDLSFDSYDSHSDRTDGRDGRRRPKTIRFVGIGDSDESFVKEVRLEGQDKWPMRSQKALDFHRKFGDSAKSDERAEGYLSSPDRKVREASRKYGDKEGDDRYSDRRRERRRDRRGDDSERSGQDVSGEYDRSPKKDRYRRGKQDDFDEDDDFSEREGRREKSERRGPDQRRKREQDDKTDTEGDARRGRRGKRADVDDEDVDADRGARSRRRGRRDRETDDEEDAGDDRGSRPRRRGRRDDEDVDDDREARPRRRGRRNDEDIDDDRETRRRRKGRKTDVDDEDVDDDRETRRRRKGRKTDVDDEDIDDDRETRRRIKGRKTDVDDEDVDDDRGAGSRRRGRRDKDIDDKDIDSDKETRSSRRARKDIDDHDEGADRETRSRRRGRKTDIDDEDSDADKEGKPRRKGRRDKDIDDDDTDRESRSRRRGRKTDIDDEDSDADGRPRRRRRDKEIDDEDVDDDRAGSRRRKKDDFLDDKRDFDKEGRRRRKYEEDSDADDRDTLKESRRRRERRREDDDDDRDVDDRETDRGRRRRKMRTDSDDDLEPDRKSRRKPARRDSDDDTDSDRRRRKDKRRGDTDGDREAGRKKRGYDDFDDDDEDNDKTSRRRRKKHGDADKAESVSESQRQSQKAARTEIRDAKDELEPIKEAQMPIKTRMALEPQTRMGLDAQVRILPDARGQREGMLMMRAPDEAGERAAETSKKTPNEQASPSTQTTSPSGYSGEPVGTDVVSMIKNLEKQIGENQKYLDSIVDTQDIHPAVAKPVVQKAVVQKAVVRHVKAGHVHRTRKTDGRYFELEAVPIVLSPEEPATWKLTSRGNLECMHPSLGAMRPTEPLARQDFDWWRQHSSIPHVSAYDPELYTPTFLDDLTCGRGRAISTSQDRGGQVGDSTSDREFLPRVEMTGRQPDVEDRRTFQVLRPLVAEGYQAAPTPVTPSAPPSYYWHTSSTAGDKGQSADQQDKKPVSRPPSKVKFDPNVRGRPSEHGTDVSRNKMDTTKAGTSDALDRNDSAQCMSSSAGSVEIPQTVGDSESTPSVRSVPMGDDDTRLGGQNFQVPTVQTEISGRRLFTIPEEGFIVNERRSSDGIDYFISRSETGPRRTSTNQPITECPHMSVSMPCVAQTGGNVQIPIGTNVSTADSGTALLTALNAERQCSDTRNSPSATAVISSTVQLGGLPANNNEYVASTSSTEGAANLAIHLVYNANFGNTEFGFSTAGNCMPSRSVSLPNVTCRVGPAEQDSSAVEFFTINPNTLSTAGSAGFTNLSQSSSWNTAEREPAKHGTSSGSAGDSETSATEDTSKDAHSSVLGSLFPRGSDCATCSISLSLTSQILNESSLTRVERGPDTERCPNIPQIEIPWNSGADPLRSASEGSDVSDEQNACAPHREKGHLQLQSFLGEGTPIIVVQGLPVATGGLFAKQIREEGVNKFTTERETDDDSISGSDREHRNDVASRTKDNDAIGSRAQDVERSHDVIKHGVNAGVCQTSSAVSVAQKRVYLDDDSDVVSVTFTDGSVSEYKSTSSTPRTPCLKTPGQISSPKGTDSNSSMTLSISQNSFSLMKSNSKTANKSRLPRRVKQKGNSFKGTKQKDNYGSCKSAENRNRNNCANQSKIKPTRRITKSKFAAVKSATVVKSTTAAKSTSSRQAGKSVVMETRSSTTTATTTTTAVCKQGVASKRTSATPSKTTATRCLKSCFPIIARSPSPDEPEVLSSPEIVRYYSVNEVSNVNYLYSSNQSKFEPQVTRGDLRGVASLNDSCTSVEYEDSDSENVFDSSFDRI